ncbi:MAG: hypothetical protein ACK56I_24090, partial [bacterium]
RIIDRTAGAGAPLAALRHAEPAQVVGRFVIRGIEAKRLAIGARGSLGRRGRFVLERQTVVVPGAGIPRVDRDGGRPERTLAAVIVIAHRGRGTQQRQQHRREQHRSGAAYPGEPADRHGQHREERQC